MKLIQGISLKWKLLIPFLGFAFVGTTTLVGLSFWEQKRLIEEQEKERIINLYDIFVSTVHEKEQTAISLASLIALEPDFANCVHAGDREELYIKALPIYQTLRAEHGIYQLHFHKLGAWSFLRMHEPGVAGERISYRASVIEVQRTGLPRKGLEWGITGLGIRGVVPLRIRDEIVGSLEVGFPLDERFLNQLKGVWKVDFAIYEVLGSDTTRPLASTFPLSRMQGEPKQIRTDRPVVKIGGKDLMDKASLLGPLRDSEGRIVALVEILVDRSQAIKELSRARNRVLIVASMGILLSSFLTYIVAIMFVRPIKEVVSEANSIAEGRRESLLKERPMDEMGVLTNALNRLLSILILRKNELERYSRLLERKVLDRTEDLIRSEEKYRTLVENLPLVVYRLLRDGTVEFVNSYFSEKLGYTIEEVVRDKAFWWEKICGKDPDHRFEIIEICWEKGMELQKERRVKTKDGRELVFMDHVIPVRSNGDVKWIDGIMMDITEIKNLQSRILEAEELRALREISARFAHEIRNPITAAGGFARRLFNSLPDETPEKRIAKVILQEVERLESVLKILLVSIEPVRLNVSRFDMVLLLKEVLEAIQKEEFGQTREVRLMNAPMSLPMQGDPNLLKEAFWAIICHGLHHMPKGEVMEVVVEAKHPNVIVNISHRAEGISKQDAAEFFLPRVSPYACQMAYPLPRARMIFKRHGGKARAVIGEIPEESGGLKEEIGQMRKVLRVTVELPYEIGQEV